METIGEVAVNPPWSCQKLEVTQRRLIVPDSQNTCQMQQAINKPASKPLSCKLTTPELRERKAEVIAKLKALVLEKKELENGYAYQFNGSDEVLDTLISFIKSERMCCDFFDFGLSVSNNGFAWLEIRGQEGVKVFIETELEM